MWTSAKITRWGPAISWNALCTQTRKWSAKSYQDPVTIKKKLVNVFKACWWISPRAYFAFFLARRKAKYYPSQIVLTNSSWELRTLTKKKDVNNFLTISSAKIPLIPFSNSEISQLRFLMSTRKYKAFELMTATFHSPGLLGTKHVSNSILTPVSDQDRISPYYIYKISCRQVMRIKKNINYGITQWSNTKFSELT